MFQRLWGVARFLSTTTNKITDVKETVRPMRPLRKPDPKKSRITLISEDQSISIVDLTVAQDISKTKRLKLVRVVDYDAQTRRPVYKLMTTSEYLKEDMKAKADKKEAKKNSLTIKGQKILALSSKISEHDLRTKINGLCKWLTKSYEVKIVISGDSTQNEKVFAQIVEGLPENTKVQQKVARASDLKFYTVPVLKPETVPKPETVIEPETSIKPETVMKPENLLSTNLQQKREIHTQPNDTKGL